MLGNPILMYGLNIHSNYGGKMTNAWKKAENNQALNLDWRTKMKEKNVNDRHGI